MKTEFNFLKNVYLYENDKCDVVDLSKINNIIKYVNDKRPHTFTHKNCNLSEDENKKIKNGLPAVQIYNSGKREKKTNAFSAWNGFCVIDLDSRNYKGNKKFVLDSEEYLHDTFRMFYNNNYFGMQKSYSGDSYHFYFGFNCDKTEENFNKVAKFSSDAVIDVFNQIGWGEFVKYEKVVDTCTIDKSVQPIFITDYEFFINDNFCGSVFLKGNNLLDEITVDKKTVHESAIRIKNVNRLKTPKIADTITNSIKDWHHDNRVKMIILLGKYFEGDREDARHIYEDFIDRIVMQPEIDNGNHTREYYMDNFDKQFESIFRKNYSINYNILKFAETNMNISFDYEIEQNFKYTTKSYGTKKIIKKGFTL